MFNNHSSNLEPNTYKGDTLRKDYCFCTPHIEDFIISCGANPFDLFISSNHREIFLDVNLLSYQKDSSTTPPTPNSRLLISTNPRTTTQYKKELMKLFLENDIINKTKIIKKNIDNNCIKESNMIQVNRVDNTITTCMLQAEKKVKHFIHSHPWSPKLIFSILEVRLWKLISSAITNNHNNSNRIKVVLSCMHLLIISALPNPIEKKNKSIVKNNLKTAN